MRYTEIHSISGARLLAVPAERIPYQPFDCAQIAHTLESNTFHYVQNVSCVYYIYAHVPRLTRADSHIRLNIFQEI